MIKLEVGKKYINANGFETKVLYIGNNHIMCSVKDTEYLYNKNKALRNWKEMPKEPNKLGQLYMCIKENKELIGSRFYGDIFVSEDFYFYEGDNFKPITINEFGEVFEAEGK
jgi:hypothetical protein